MKTQEKAVRKSKATKNTLPKDVVVNPELNNRYDDQPLFQDKINRANHILKTVGIPDFGKKD